MTCKAESSRRDGKLGPVSPAPSRRSRDPGAGYSHQRYLPEGGDGETLSPRGYHQMAPLQLCMLPVALGTPPRRRRQNHVTLTPGPRLPGAMRYLPAESSGVAIVFRACSTGPPPPYESKRSSPTARRRRQGHVIMAPEICDGGGEPYLSPRHCSRPMLLPWMLAGTIGTPRRRRRRGHVLSAPGDLPPGALGYPSAPLPSAAAKRSFSRRRVSQIMAPGPIPAAPADVSDGAVGPAPGGDSRDARGIASYRSAYP